MGSVVRTCVGVEIDRQPEQVWTVVCDYDSDRRWRKGILEMTPDSGGSRQVGTRVREVLKVAGRTHTTDTVVTELGPGMSYCFAGTGTSGQVRGSRSVRPGKTPDSAVFTYEVELEHAIPRAAQPFLAWWLRRTMRRDLNRLRHLLEST